jgi:hypothetical protein
MFIAKAGPFRNLGDSSTSVDHPRAASTEAKAKMPTKYTEYDFVLIRLHEWGAGTISTSVTTQERVGRSMSPGAPTQGETKMNTSMNHGSAKIYQFPAGGRSALGGRRDEDAKTADLVSPHAGAVACSGSWYHEAAIREQESGRDC